MTESTVFVLDDNEGFRESTVWLLESMGYLTENFENPITAIQRLDTVHRAEPAALLLDIRMPSMSGLDVHDKLNELAINVPIMYMTAHGDVPVAVAAMSKGALTFLEKPLDESLLKTALELAFSDAVQRPRDFRGSREEYLQTKERLALLTPREKQIVDAMLHDKTNKEIASSHHISIKTVELYRSRAMSKLEAKNAAHLVRMVMSSEAL